MHSTFTVSLYVCGNSVCCTNHFIPNNINTVLLTKIMFFYNYTFIFISLFKIFESILQFIYRVYICINSSAHTATSWFYNNGKMYFFSITEYFLLIIPVKNFSNRYRYITFRKENFSFLFFLTDCHSFI